jgi:predicted transposase/invertase (TIGR01784 family)
VAGLDFSSLEKVPVHFVTDDLRSRESDVVWRIRSGGDRWLYIYLLLEFQSTVDPFMAVRLLTYVGLLYQDLIRTGVVKPGDKLPPVLPLVLYNGDRRWRAAEDLAELVQDVPRGLEPYQPRLRYFLLDEGRIAEEELGALRNVAAALFRLERSRTPADIEQVLVAMLEWLKDPEQAELRRAFAIWLVRVLLPARLPGIEIPKVMELQEVKTMLEERVKEWTQEWQRTGFDKGVEKGMEKGIEKSLSSLRSVLLRQLEGRFGSLPEGVRERLEAIRSVEALGELIARIPQVSSLAALDL